MEGIVRGDDGGGREKAMRTDYPGNSQKARHEKTPAKERAESVITNPATTRKKSRFDRFAHSIFAEDADGVMSYIVMDILLPAFKSLVFDTISGGAERALYGENRRGSSPRQSGYTNYSRVSTERTPRAPLSRQARTTHDFDDILIQTRTEAENVIDGLQNMIDQYGQATVGDLYDLVGLTADFPDNAWGWREGDLRDAKVRSIRGGYLLDLPRTRAL